MSDYIKFFSLSEKPKVISIENKRGQYLGYIEYYNHWRQFVLKPQDDTVFSTECLQEIIKQLAKLNGFSKEREQ